MFAVIGEENGGGIGGVIWGDQIGRAAADEDDKCDAYHKETAKLP
jgi:hypothetical protein